MTPALVLDLDAFEQNISAYQQLINAHGLKARPHAKSHKCAEIARRQIAAGSIGISTATLHEAEALAEKGITDILITSPIVGLAKCERLLQLLECGIVLTIVVDNLEQVPLPSTSHLLNVLVDIDLGMGRTGVRNVDSALRLVDTVSNTKGLLWRGLQAYSGKVQHIADFSERSTTYSAQLRLLYAACRSIVIVITIQASVYTPERAAPSFPPTVFSCFPELIRSCPWDSGLALRTGGAASR